MSRPGESHTLYCKVVVVFDICSSTAILDDLIHTENHRRWVDLLIRLKEFLVVRSKKDGFEIYKFVGDGYVLLFSAMHNPEAIFELLRDICEQYDGDYNRKVMPFLQRPPAVVGITFGVDRGSLMCVTMREQPEYIGRALNVAFRLQGALKDKDRQPAGKALVAAHYYSTMRSVLTNWDVTRVKRTLRNIGADLSCYKVGLVPNRKRKRSGNAANR